MMEDPHETLMKKMKRIMEPCACTGELWDYVILLPAVPYGHYNRTCSPS